VKKPFSIVLDEIEWIGSKKIGILLIQDANFGIYDIDVAITEHIVDMAKKYGYPNLVYSENAKNHLERTTKIKELLLEQGLLDHHKISIQAIDEEIKDNVQRIDPPIEEQINSINYLKSKFPDLPVKVEVILGLPGDTYQKTLDQMDILINHGMNAARPNLWMLLPETPAFSPETREKFQIKTVFKMMPTTPWVSKENFEVHPAVWSTNSGWANANVETVVATYSYTKDDWLDMHFIEALAYANTLTAINQTLCVYMKHQHDVNPSVIQDFIYKNYINPNTVKSNYPLKTLFEKSYRTMHRWLYDDDYKISGVDYNQAFPFYLPPTTYLALIILTNSSVFYSQLCQDLADKFNDPAILDLGIYLTNSVLDSEYDPDTGRTFTTKHDWLKYFDTKQLQEGSFTYHVSDQTILINSTYQSIVWHQYRANRIKHHEQYMYQALGVMATKFSQTIKLCE
jgi:hypothetical protein